jgi:adenine-specific DNA-methyltransferase
MDYIETIPVVQLLKALGKKVCKKGTLFEELESAASGISKVVKRRGGGDFICCELMKYNQAFRERIQAAKPSAELVQIWHEMAEGSFLNWYVNPKMPEEAARDFETIGRDENGLEEQKRLLAELLDKNQSYVNLSEIDDAQFKVSQEEKELNHKFYGE